jgi:DNA mismatch repair protein MutS2
MAEAEVRFFPLEAVQKLGFDQVCKQLAGYCRGEMAKTAALQLQITTDYELLNLRLGQAREMQAALTYDDPLPLPGSLPALNYVFAKAAVVGNYITEEEALRLQVFLQTVRKCRGYLANRKEKYPKMALLLGDSALESNLGDYIARLLGPDGKMRDDASKELAQYRKLIREKSNEARSLLQKILRQARSEGYTDEKEPALRNERLVIPLKVEAKNRIPGFVHDVSASGHTLYIEPVEALQLNNAVQEYRLRERNEVIKILIALTDRIRPELPVLTRMDDFLTALDLLQAKARLALAMQAQLPAITPIPDSTKNNTYNRRLEIFNARHPLLLLHKKREQVVPLTIVLDEKLRILLISGPNAGGKSVALQTVGLLQVMLQAGLLVPVDDHSSFPLVSKLFVDLGDDQSLQNDLSTYTAHLTRMRELVVSLDNTSLFLIDEFGTGTDPRLGAAMAEALLAFFVTSGGQGIITTHYGNLKEYAENHAEVVNAAMEFDIQHLTPTYRLLQGLPGSSYTFEIAARVGIPAEIIENARQKAGSSYAETERLLANLRQQEIILTELIAQNKQQKEALELQARQQAELEKRNEIHRQKLLQQAQQTAAELVRKANRKIEETIKEITTAYKERISSRTLRKQLLQVAEMLPDQEMLSPEELIARNPRMADDTTTAISVGDQVRIGDSFSIGEVLSIDKDKRRAVIAMGDLRTTTNLSDLVRVVPINNDIHNLKYTNNTRENGAFSTVRKMAEFDPKLDLRGLRVDEALRKLETFIDQALPIGNNILLEILHGKGTGALRKAVRAHLRKNYPQIKDITDAPEDLGGSGITICRLG